MINMTETGAFTTIYRGVEYYMRVDALNRYEVTSQRLTLKKAGFGSVRHFETLEQVESKIKAFAGLSKLI